MEEIRGEDMAKNKSVLACTSEKETIGTIQASSTNEGMEVVFVRNHRTLVERLHKSKPLMILIDIDQENSDVISLIRALSENSFKIPVVLIGTYEEKLFFSIESMAQKRGILILKFIRKPLNQEELIKTFKEIKVSRSEINEEAITSALERDQFLMAFQPKMKMDTESIIGFESLLRWNDPSVGIITPDHFIPVAEESGLIVPLTYWTIKKVFEQCTLWNHEKQKIRISINLSPQVLNDASFPDEVMKLLKEFDFDPRLICFEITESAAMGQRDVVLEVLIKLRLKGFFLSIDDFGTGYSSLVELQRLPFTELKIDKSFVIGLETSKINQIIVKSIIDLAHHMDLQVVAEGVETLDSFKKLLELGCDIAQGYLIAKPVPAENLKNNFIEEIETVFKQKKMRRRGGD